MNPMSPFLIDPIQPSVDHTSPIESESLISQILLVSSYSNEWGGNPLFLTVQGGKPPIPIVHRGDPTFPIMQGGISPIPTIPPPSSMFTSFDWSQLT